MDNSCRWQTADCTCDRKHSRDAACDRKHRRSMLRLSTERVLNGRRLTGLLLFVILLT